MKAVICAIGASVTMGAKLESTWSRSYKPSPAYVPYVTPSIELSNDHSTHWSKGPAYTETTEVETVVTPTLWEKLYDA